jgi:adenosylcobinamide-GDP ribazoletransferase
MAATVLLTGAFHEDGFADMCDAFGGGWTIEKKLSIMKDSRIGTYGSVGLIFILSAKFMLLYEINPVKLPLVLIFGHTVSRIVPVWLIYTLPYVQDIDVSKSKPIGHKNKLYELFLACGIAVLPFLIFKVKFAFIIVFLILFTLYFKYYLKKQIGGYTGDCLGASQQLGEIIIYIAFLVIWKFLP